MFDFLIHVAAIACIYSILALNLNLQAGFAGMMNFGLIAMFGCGMYAAALVHRFGWSALATLPLAAVAATLLGLFLRGSAESSRATTGGSQLSLSRKSCGSSRTISKPSQVVPRASPACRFSSPLCGLGMASRALPFFYPVAGGFVAVRPYYAFGFRTLIEADA